MEQQLGKHAELPHDLFLVRTELRVSLDSGGPSASSGVGLTCTDSGSSSWKITSCPRYTFVENEMLISSRVGKFLDGSGYFDTFMWLCVLLQVLISVFAAIDPTALSWRSKLVQIPRSITIFMHCVMALGLAFLFAHRCNRSLLQKTWFLLDFWLVFVPYVFIYVLWGIYNFQYGESDNVGTIVEHAIVLLFRLPVLVMISALDSLFNSRRARLVISIILCANFLSGWVVTRCFSKSWGVVPDCSVYLKDGIANRELYLKFTSHLIFFLFTGLMNLVSGAHFCYLHPHFAVSVAVSSTADNDVVTYVSRPCNLTVKRRMLLQTRIGDCLERYSYMDKLMVGSLASTALFSVLFNQTVSYKRNSFGTVVCEYTSLSTAFHVVAVCSQILLLFLVLHRFNSELFRLCFLRFEVVLVAISGWCCFTIGNYHHLSTYGHGDVVLRALDYLSTLVLQALFAANDAFRVTRRVRMLMACFVLFFYVNQYVRERCFTLRWGYHSECGGFLSGQMGDDTISTQEVYLSLTLFLFLFFARRSVVHLQGGCLAAYRPSFVPESVLAASSQAEHSQDSTGGVEENLEGSKFPSDESQIVENKGATKNFMESGNRACENSDPSIGAKSDDTRTNEELLVEQPQASPECRLWMKRPTTLKSSSDFQHHLCQLSL